MSTNAAKAYKGIGMNGVIAKWYASITRKGLDAYRKDAQLVAEHLAEGASVLEAASGPGYLAIELAKLDRYRVTGLDISAKFVEIAQANAQAEGVAVDFRLGNAAEMPFDEESFDFVVCRAAFKNFAQPVHALDEMYRVLRPGGQALILDLRGDVSVEEVNHHVDRELNLSGINAFMTKWAFRSMLIRRAYTRDQFRAFASQSAFGACELEDDAIGVRVWLRR